MGSSKRLDIIHEEILDKVKEYYHELNSSKESFTPGKSRISYSGRVYDQDEMLNLVDSSLEFWLTTGRYARDFEDHFAEFLGVKYCYLCNSGSSANLLAFIALTSPELGDRSIQRGDEVITVAAGFPTTVAPIVQYGAIPVFVDVELPSANIDVTWLETALSDRTKAIMIAHTLGNPFNISIVKNFCDKHKLWLIEDNCDALGSKHKGKYTGTIGDIGTSSFYPPHHMTMGEGGAVYTNSSELSRILLSLRDWGRDCICPSGVDNLCGHRFDRKFGELPKGYDHKYVYSHLGFNLKVTDMQAAIGCAQLKKLPSFIEARKHNWSQLYDGLKDLTDYFVLPKATDDSEPSWFGFLLTLRDDVEFDRDQIVRYLESNNIQTRMLFAGNLLRHPCFDEMRKTGQGFRIVSDLINTDIIMNESFWIGVYPGLTPEMLNYMISVIHDFVMKRVKSI